MTKWYCSYSWKLKQFLQIIALNWPLSCKGQIHFCLHSHFYPQFWILVSRRNPYSRAFTYRCTHKHFSLPFIDMLPTESSTHDDIVSLSCGSVTVPGQGFQWCHAGTEIKSFKQYRKIECFNLTTLAQAYPPVCSCLWYQAKINCPSPRRPSCPPLNRRP